MSLDPQAIPRPLAVPAIDALGDMRTRMQRTGQWQARQMAGRRDVAFHVDMTQQRAGYRSEADLNPLRREYMERARGLPISVFFNTTVHAGNFEDLAKLAALVAQADMVRFASFQLQAETGLGLLGARTEAIGNDSVARRLQQGAGTPLQFNGLSAGHHDCNRCLSRKPPIAENAH